MIMAGVGYLVARYSGHTTMGGIIIGLAGVVLVSGWVVPPVFDAMDRFGNLVAHAAGVVATWVLLVPFYYACFVSGRVVLMLRGKDPLEREFPGHKPSYWVNREPPSDADRYRNQS